MNYLIISTNEGMALTVLRCLSLHNSINHVINVGKTSQSSRFSRYCKSYSSYPISASLEQSEDFINNVYLQTTKWKTTQIILRLHPPTFFASV